MDVKQKIYEEMILPFFKKEPRYIGNEIETFLFSPKGEKNNKLAVNHVFNLLIKEKGFSVEIMGTDGFIVRVSNGVDAISCDYSYQLLEFSMGKDVTIRNIAVRFYDYCAFLKKEFLKLGFIFTGMGTNHFRLPFENDDQFTHDPFYTQVRKYVLEKSKYKDPAYFYPMMASVQSHIEVNGNDMIKIYNLFNRIDFVRALLFSNSIPNTEIKQNYLIYPNNLICARDILWDYQALPNTGIVGKDFESVEELIDHISEQKVFVSVNNGKLKIIDPVTVSDYVSKGNTLSTYRSFEHVVINNYHVIEVRSDCSQPLRDAFAPLAFNVGIAYNWEQAYKTLDKFYSNSNLPKNNKELRNMAITQQIHMMDLSINKLLRDLIEISKGGLMKRGTGEERYLDCLYYRAENCVNPAIETQKMLKQGFTMLDIAQEYSKLY